MINKQILAIITLGLFACTGKQNLAKKFLEENRTELEFVYTKHPIPAEIKEKGEQYTKHFRDSMIQIKENRKAALLKKMDDSMMHKVHQFALENLKMDAAPIYLQYAIEKAVMRSQGDLATNWCLEFAKHFPADMFAEDALWIACAKQQDLKNPQREKEILNLYLKAYPNGKYAPAAHHNIRYLEGDSLKMPLP